MSRNETLLIEWAKKVRTEWKHVPSLKGKQGDTNLIILRILATSKTFKGAWDLALEYLKYTEPKFGLWDDNKIYRERMKKNSTMNRRLTFLAEKRYVKKIGSLYRLTMKGLYLIWAIEPKIMARIPEDMLNQDFEDVEMDFQIVPGRVKDAIGIASEPTYGNYKTLARELDEDPLKNELQAMTAKKILLSLKINLDEIEPKELFNLLVSKCFKTSKKKD